MLPISAIIVTKSVSREIERTLISLKAFDDIWIVDSDNSKTLASLAQKYGATYQPFQWTGTYPKKRQWCLDHLPLKHSWVLFIDADERLSQALQYELEALFQSPQYAQGYFIKGRYVIEGQKAGFGLANNKLCLFQRDVFHFPEIDDLSFDGMGEIEGHYQPVCRQKNIKIRQLHAPIWHDAFDNPDAWTKRHMGYARWEAQMIKHNAYPKDPIMWRQFVKYIFRRIPLRAELAFCHSYVFKLGFMDGALGVNLACQRYKYYKMVQAALRRF